MKLRYQVTKIHPGYYAVKDTTTGNFLPHHFKTGYMMGSKKEADALAQERNGVVVN